MSIEQESVGSAIAPALSSLEMGAVLGTYEKALKTPQIQEARNRLVGNEQIGRFDRMMELFTMAGGHGMLSLIDRATVDFPESSVGENSTVLYLLMLGAVSHKSAATLTNIRTSYIEQMRNLGESLGKTPNKLQLPDLGEAIINNSFNLEPLQYNSEMEESNKETRTPFTKQVLNSLGDFEKDVLYLMGTSTEPEKTANIRADLVRLKEDEESYTDAINNLVNQGLLKRAETEDGEEIVTPREDVQEYFERLEQDEK